jgi:hypothetical protein
MKQIEVEITQTYTRTITSTMEVPKTYKGIRLVKYIENLNLTDEIDGEFECTELEKSGEPVFYYKDNVAKTGGYIKLKT